MTKPTTVHATCAKAIRAELAAAFPGQKFSVRARTASMMSAVDVHWTDGPTSAAVKAIIDKYQYGHFDGMTDHYEMSNKQPGLVAQVKYVSAYRTIADETKALVEEGLAACGFQDDSYRRDEIVNRIYGKTDLSKGALGVRKTNVTCGSLEEFFEIVTPDSPAETEPRCERCSAIVGADGHCEPCAERARREESAKASYAAHIAKEAAAKALLADVVALEVAPADYPRLTARFAQLNKRGTLEEYHAECAKGDFWVGAVQVTHVVNLTNEQFLAFSENLLTGFPWLNGLGGNDSDYQTSAKTDVQWCNLPEDEKDKWRAQSYTLGVLVTRPDGYEIVVDPQGHDYARYVGLVENIGSQVA